MALKKGPPPKGHKAAKGTSRTKATAKPRYHRDPENGRLPGTAKPPSLTKAGVNSLSPVQPSIAAGATISTPTNSIDALIASRRARKIPLDPEGKPLPIASTAPAQAVRSAPVSTATPTTAAERPHPNGAEIEQTNLLPARTWIISHLNDFSLIPKDQQWKAVNVFMQLMKRALHYDQNVVAFSYCERGECKLIEADLDIDPLS